MYQDILCDVGDSIATITLNRPDVFNAIRVQTYKDIIACLQDCEQRADVSVIILTGAAGKFCAGNDLSDLLPGGDLAGVQQGVAGIFDTLAAMQKPLILAQEGVAVGIGANLLLHADLAFAGRSIRYSLPFSKIGVAAEGGSSVLLKEAIGAKAAADLLLTGRFFSAEEAVNWGFINAAVDDGSALEHAVSAAKALLQNSQASLRAIKQLGRQENHRQRVNAAVKAEMDAFSELLQTEETQMRIKQVLKGKG
ncbi:enoyl-CoA hydratase [Bacterioplanes sanyensis]|uniref:Enoyl-CoA hydratase n=1 Tax=Bacterioplanes sanyensis TaxID=1249553 RepID=A0A222FKK2_9GAMM|nr:enoyl-CoA hydratase-related protein [Bacterioplanes sanyensis]ASP39279.1 enoyl-CoA hydratase [Bacterioplanes sanyensis]